MKTINLEFYIIRISRLRLGHYKRIFTICIIMSFGNHRGAWTNNDAFPWFEFIYTPTREYVISSFTDFRLYKGF